MIKLNNIVNLKDQCHLKIPRFLNVNIFCSNFDTNKYYNHKRIYEINLNLVSSENPSAF